MQRDIVGDVFLFNVYKLLIYITFFAFITFLKLILERFKISLW